MNTGDMHDSNNFFYFVSREYYITAIFFFHHRTDGDRKIRKIDHARGDALSVVSQTRAYTYHTERVCSRREVGLSVIILYYNICSD